MARSRLTAGLPAVFSAAVMVTTVGAALMGVTVPAAAQFGSIFSDEPPRPPGSVPRGGQQMPPADLGRGGDVRSGVDVRRPNLDADQPPARPLPAPMSLPPSSRPGGGTIQSTPLAPPPGATAAPPAAAPVQPLPPPGEAPQGTARTTPGLPPGIRQPRGTPGPADTSPQPGDEVVVAPPPQRIANPNAVFSGLDKITGRIISFDVAINETVQFGALQVTPRVCYTRPPTETPNTDAFIQVDEVTLQGEIKRIFEGWMFAASPGLHAVEHPIYDVWITDCKGGVGPEVAEAPPEPAKPAARTPARQPAQQRPSQPRGQQQPGLPPTLR